MPKERPETKLNLKQPIFSTGLPPELFYEIGKFLNQKDVAAFTQSCGTAKFFGKTVLIKKMALRLVQLVSYGKQDEAKNLLDICPNCDIANILSYKSTFTDYQGRTFKCSAYEYAWWAKDTHMRKMLEQYMDDDTKARTLERCSAIEEQGLTYQQHGETKNSKHCDLQPLIDALQAYVDGIANWYENDNWDAIDNAWLQVGKAQRDDVPVHVINEYCRPDRSFDPCPDFNEAQLPRVTTYYNFNTHGEEQLFPLVVSDTSGLGLDFSLLRGVDRRAFRARGGPCAAGVAALDLTAIRRLDEVRTADLKLSLENLKPRLPSPGLSRY